MDPALQRLIANGGGADEVAVLVRVATPDAAPPPFAQVVSRFGMVMTVRVPRGRLAELHDDDGVLSVKAGRLYRPELVRVAAAPTEDVAARASDQRHPDGLAATGRGVVVGVIDWGLDFRHRAFRDAHGATRVRALWDQTATGPAATPNRFGYGAIHLRTAIDAALRTADPVAALGYDPATWDVGGGSHGTATTSVAAGGAWSTGPDGMAPDAEIVFVNLAGADALSHSTKIAEAIDFISEAAGDQPWVVNMSLGRHTGPHDGCTLLEELMDAAVAEGPGRAIVNSAGNYLSADVHTAGRLRTGETVTVPLRVHPSIAEVHEIDVWYRGADRLVVGLIAPDGRDRVAARPGSAAKLTIDGRVAATVQHRLDDPNNGRNEAVARIEPAAPAGDWRLLISAIVVVDGRFDAWIEREAVAPGTQVRFAHDDAVTTTTTGTICNGRHTIAVGAYDAHDDDRPLTRFSSSGDTVDGRRKPDLVAPGEDVLAARSAPRGDRGDVADGATRMSGTSLAAPFVTGTIACMLEVAGHVPVATLRDALLRGAERYEGDEPLRAGDGYLDARAACATVRRRAPPGPQPPIPSLPSTPESAMPTMIETEPAPTTDVSPDDVLKRLGTTARGLFEAFVLESRPTERERLSAHVTSIAAPVERVGDALRAGDLLVRGVMGEGRALLAVLVTGELISDRDAGRRNDLELEANLPGRYAWVVEGGARPRARDERFARRVADQQGFLPIDQALLRLTDQPAAPAPTPMHSVPEDAEAVNRNGAAYVRWYQDALNRIDGAGLAGDGIIGPLTRAAVRRYQARKGLAADGIVGPNTERALVLDGAVAPPGFTGPLPSGPPAPTPPGPTPAPPTPTPSTAVRVRRDVTALSPQELAALAAAINQLRRSGRYAQFVVDHNASVPDAHQQPAFLPWHRQFILYFESELRAIDPSVTLPYWNWATDPGQIAGRASWNPSMLALLGGDGDVTAGPFAGWREFDTSGRVTSTPVHRDFGRNVPSLPRPDDVTLTLAETPYDAPGWDTRSPGFRNTLEGTGAASMHNTVHIWVGGSMLPMSSPNDPVFFLHHCMVDKVWADWQAAHPGLTYLPPTQQARPGRVPGWGINDPVKVLGVTGASPVTYRAADTLDLRNLRDHRGATVSVQYA